MRSFIKRIRIFFPLLNWFSCAAQYIPSYFINMYDIKASKYLLSKHNARHCWEMGRRNVLQTCTGNLHHWVKITCPVVAGHTNSIPLSNKKILTWCISNIVKRYAGHQSTCNQHTIHAIHITAKNRAQALTVHSDTLNSIYIISYITVFNKNQLIFLNHKLLDIHPSWVV